MSKRKSLENRTRVGGPATTILPRAIRQTRATEARARRQAGVGRSVALALLAGIVGAAMPAQAQDRATDRPVQAATNSAADGLSYQEVLANVEIIIQKWLDTAKNWAGRSPSQEVAYYSPRPPFFV